MKGRHPPHPGLLRWIDALGRAATPTVSTAVLLVLAATPFGPPGLVPAIALPCVAFWSLVRPAALPAPSCFVLGLLQDLLTAAPAGTGPLVLLLAHGLVQRARGVLVRLGFVAAWLAFCALALGAAGLGWLLQAVLAWQMPPLAPALVQAGMAAGLYPLFACVLMRVDAAMRHAESAP